MLWIPDANSFLITVTENFSRLKRKPSISTFLLNRNRKWTLATVPRVLKSSQFLDRTLLIAEFPFWKSRKWSEHDLFREMQTNAIRQSRILLSSVIDIFTEKIIKRIVGRQRLSREPFYFLPRNDSLGMGNPEHLAFERIRVERESCSRF